MFDAVTGIPMALGAFLGGMLYRASYTLPFFVAIALFVPLTLTLIPGSARTPAKVTPSKAD